MKKTGIIGVMLAFIMALISGVSVFSADKELSRGDEVKEEWYTEAFNYCIETGILGSYSDTEIEPHSAVSRAELAAALWKSAGEPSVREGRQIWDIETDASYSQAVQWVYSMDIISGCSEHIFGPEDKVTREQMAAILYRFENIEKTNEPVAGTIDFLDEDMISNWAKQGILWAVSNNIISGRTGNIFAPKENVTYAEASVMLYHYINRGTADNTRQQGEPEENPMIQVKVTVGNQSYDAWFYNSESALAFLELLPQTLNMSELNNNEKYYHLDSSLPTDAGRIGSIHSGDIMLYGSNSIVLFYKDFQTSYSYTPLGYMENPQGLEQVVGRGNVTVTFEIQE